MSSRRLLLLAVAWAGVATARAGEGPTTPLLARTGVERGVCVVLGLDETGGAGAIADLARASQLTIYFQSPRAADVAAVREAASAAGLLGKRVFADVGPCGTIPLADNLADVIVVAPAVERKADDRELLRVLHPDGAAVFGSRQLVKPPPAGTDAWSHVFHGPDNNPLSTDQLARAPYLTQFLGDPKFVPMPEVSVAAGGRVFRAFGHIAHKANQNALLNTLVGINGYNGIVLWQRPLHEGFMIHRNTMIATPDTLYLGDDQSCKLLDARTGRLLDQIVVPPGVSDGPVWKWMALDGGTLYGLVGGAEIRPRTQPSAVAGMGHWPWGMWEGHDYKDPRTNFGFGRTLLAIDLRTKAVKWSHREDQYLDARGVCMQAGHIYGYSPGRFLACVSAASGELLWKNAEADLLEAIGRDGPAQLWLTGYATTTFIKGSERYLIFAGPQRKRLVVASTDNGKLLWQKEPGNLQVLLREGALYCAGPQGTEGFKLDAQTGRQLALLPARRACTRATGSVDSVFFRANGGTVRIDVVGDKARHIAPMRPPCQDGVIISDGLLYWGPWMCGCQLSLYGHICLGPAGRFDFHPPADPARLATADDAAAVQPLSESPGDWPTYLGDNARSGSTAVHVPQQVSQRWSYRLPGSARPSAPVVAGGLVFLGDESGAVSALNAADGTLRWRTYTGGAVFFPPALWQDRLYAGSADGRVYCFEAASGRRLWSFRAAPADRRIPVYGRLMSTWPVAGGVAVADGTVFAAAGIAHYDGTYVYALDALTGRVKWSNDTSGSLSEDIECGISLQGDVALVDGELRFLGGGKYETARYDLQTGRCLNEPDNTLASQYRTAFYPYYPDYGSYVALARVLPDGKELVCDASYDGSQHPPLMLLGPPPAGVPRPVKPAARFPLPNRRGAGEKPVWVDRNNRQYNAFVVAPGILLTAGQTKPPAEAPFAPPAPPPASAFLAAINTTTGADTWQTDLPAPAVRAGLAVDHQGRIVAALENGQILGFSSPTAENSESR